MQTATAGRHLQMPYLCALESDGIVPVLAWIGFVDGPLYKRRVDHLADGVSMTVDQGRDLLVNGSQHGVQRRRDERKE